jgi:hypothetical protein
MENVLCVWNKGINFFFFGGGGGGYAFFVKLNKV